MVCIAPGESKPFRACIETAPTRDKLTQRLIQVLEFRGIPSSFAHEQFYLIGKGNRIDVTGL